VNGILAAVLREDRARLVSAPEPTAELDALVSRLERASEQLRTGDLSADAAASLVEEAAHAAAQASAELERLARQAAASPFPARTSSSSPDGLRPRARDGLLSRPPARPGRGLPAGAALLRRLDHLRAGGGHALLAPGRRQADPPVLALATARALRRDADEVLPLAAAIELIHTYSLIHDDLPAMDDDDLRRGRPTCHVAYGEDVAILAGDGLYAEAFRHVLTHQTGEPAHVLRPCASSRPATGVNGMVGGQYLDVHDSGPAGPEGLRRLHSLKTGRLIGASVECVLLLGGMTSCDTPYQRYASELGVLFQIVDDILDVTGTADDLGKPQGSDERHGKRTYVSEFGWTGPGGSPRSPWTRLLRARRGRTRRAPRARADHALHLHTTH
jgi:geranylgeranyl diphosphate synthase type II